MTIPLRIRGHPQVVAHQRQLIQGVGAGGARCVCHLAQFSVMRACVCAVEAAVWRAADVVARRLGAGGADAQLQWALCGPRHMQTQLHADSAACQLSTQHVNSELSRLMRLAMYGGLDGESSADLPSDIMTRVVIVEFEF